MNLSFSLLPFHSSAARPFFPRIPTRIPIPSFFFRDTLFRAPTEGFIPFNDECFAIFFCRFVNFATIGYRSIKIPCFPTDRFYPRSRVAWVEVWREYWLFELLGITSVVKNVVGRYPLSLSLSHFHSILSRFLPFPFVPSWRNSHSSPSSSRSTERTRQGFRVPEYDHDTIVTRLVRVVAA